MDELSVSGDNMAAAALSNVVDVTASNFETAVIGESQVRPVIVDFWSPRCQPCMQLAPLLEAAVEKLGGKVLLAKVNTDVEPELSQAFQVSSIPMVVAIANGQMVDRFVGMLPPEQVDQWVAKLAPSRAQELVQQAAIEMDADPASAAAKFREALVEEPEFDAAKVALARCLVEVGQRDEASQLIEQLEKRGFLEPEAEQVKSILALPVADSDDVSAARAAAAANPEDLSLVVALAEALAGSQQDGEALELALDVVRKDRDGSGQLAKEVMVHVFDRLGAGSPLVGEYRRKLATLLY